MPLRSQRRFISKTNVKSGMMVEFNYTKSDSTASTYTILVVDPDKSGYLHGVLINDLSDTELIKFTREVGEEFNYNSSERKEPITNLQSDGAYQRYKSSEFGAVRRYRTFVLNKVTNIRQILIGVIDE